MNKYQLIERVTRFEINFLKLYLNRINPVFNFFYIYKLAIGFQ